MNASNKFISAAALAACLGLSCALGAALPFMLWLEGPKRNNPNDPKSASFTPPAPAAMATATPVLSPTPTFSPSPTATPSYLWQDFETDVSANFWYPNGPSFMNQSWSSDTAVSGTHSWKMDTGPGSSYGHWTGLDAVPPVNLSGATQIKLWYKCNQSLVTELHWVEGTGSGADGETWWRNITIVGDSTWHQLSFSLGSFFLAGSPGNSTPDPQSVATIWFYHVVPYNAHVLYIDDIQFTP